MPHYDKNMTSGQNFGLPVTLQQDDTEAEIRESRSTIAIDADS